jgi:hypothetical protein
VNTSAKKSKKRSFEFPNELPSFTRRSTRIKTNNEGSFRYTRGNKNTPLIVTTIASNNLNTVITLEVLTKVDIKSNPSKEEE